MNISKEQYFNRQTTLAEIGEAGQQLLQNAKVLVIGCGGLGSPTAIYLAASGIGELHLVDFDTVSISNLHRQVFYKVEDIGKFKAQILAAEIKKKSPFTKVTFSNKAVDKNSILNLVSKFDIVVDGTDSLQVKYLINDACVLTKKPLIYGSLYKFDGYVATFNVLNNEGYYSCNLRDAFPKIATDIPNCEEAGTMNPIVGIIAMLQANEVVKLITNTGKLLTNQLLIYNVLENSQFKMKLKKNTTLDISTIFKNATYLDESCENQNQLLLISASELKEKLTDKNIEIIGVNILRKNVPFKISSQYSRGIFNINKFYPDFEKQYIFVCQKGIASYEIVLKLKERFPNLSLLSLNKGINNY
jgi:adenylyltransferase/sulfurtransferase